jgi:hypothetical protein
MKYYRSKGSEELFNKWKALSFNLEHLASLVQNPMTISTDDLDDWRVKSIRVLASLDILRKETSQFIETQRLVDEPVAEGHDSE